MKVIPLDEDRIGEDLFPFTLTRPVSGIRIGILTILEKWSWWADHRPGLLDAIIGAGFRIPANLLPNQEITEQILLGKDPFSWPGARRRTVRYPWQILEMNAEEIGRDLALLRAGRSSAPIPKGIHTQSPGNIFIEPGARLWHAVLNAEQGPIYIGPDTEIMEGALIRGPFALCRGAIIKMGACIYGATTIGPKSVAGGEIKNSVIFGYSNKAHEGYLGDSVIGEWCNIGAGCSNSNLKNSAGSIKIWNEPRNSFFTVGQKCGIFMGDFSRASIQTRFNSGTVVGVGANIFGSGLTPHFIPSFSWGQEGKQKYQWDKVLRDLTAWKRMKNEELGEEEILRLRDIFEKS